MRPESRRPSALGRVTMSPAALDSGEESDPERHSQALKKLKEGRIGHCGSSHGVAPGFLQTDRA